MVAITGPRQSGKTNRAYASLEDPDTCDFATTDPRGFLAQFPDGAVLDEAQRCPELFSYLQGIVDRDSRPGHFILTGSQQFGLMSGITQSLAGRVALLTLLPFSVGELQSSDLVPSSIEALLFQGMYPPIYDRQLKPRTWYANYIDLCGAGCAATDQRT